MSDRAAQVAVIIPHHEDPVRLARCLAALTTAPGRAAAEILVVDNGSAADLAPLRARFPAVRFVVEHERGAAAARNRGMVETRAPRLAFLDADCLPAQDWLDRAATLPLPGGDGLLGGRIDTFDETPPPRSGAQAFEAVFAFRQAAYVRRKGFSVTANLVVSRRAAEATGPMRPGLSEDMDWCHRARAAGFALAYAPDLVVAHPTRADRAALVAKWRRLVREAHALHQARGGGRLGWALRALAMPAIALWQAPQVLRAPQLSGWGERGGALRTLAAMRLRRGWWMLGQALRG